MSDNNHSYSGEIASDIVAIIADEQKFILSERAIERVREKVFTGLQVAQKRGELIERQAGLTPKES